MKRRFINLKRKMWPKKIRFDGRDYTGRIRFTFEDNDARVSLDQSPDGMIRVKIDDDVGKKNIIFMASKEALYNLGFALDWTKIYDTRRDK